MLATLHKLYPIYPIRPSHGFFKANRARFLSLLKSAFKLDSGFLLFKGPIEQSIYDDDCEFLLVPEANFAYLFGVDEPETWGLIDLETERATLLLHETSPERSYWMKVKTHQEFEKEFDGEAVAKIKDLASLLGLTEETKASFAKRLFIMEGPNRETQAGLHAPTAKDVGDLCAPLLTPSKELYQAVCQARKDKSEEEVRLLMHAAEANHQTASSLLAYVKEDKTEVQLANHFKAIAMYAGNYPACFNPQIAFGQHGLKGFHDPSKLTHAHGGDLAVIETGLRVNGVCSRMIRTVPISGHYTEQQREVYDGLLDVYRQVAKGIKAGVKYQQVIETLEAALTGFLVKLGVLKLENPNAMSSEVLKHFYEQDVLGFIGFDPSDPLSLELRLGEAEGELKGNSALFFKLAVTFDQAMEGDKTVVMERVRELGQIAPAVKFGDVVLVKEGTTLPLWMFGAIESKQIEEIRRLTVKACEEAVVKV